MLLDARAMHPHSRRRMGGRERERERERRVASCLVLARGQAGFLRIRLYRGDVSRTKPGKQRYAAIYRASQKRVARRSISSAVSRGATRKIASLRFPLSDIRTYMCTVRD